MTRRVAILGCTGSIGSQTLDVIDALNRDEMRFDVVALTAHQNAEALAAAQRRWPGAKAALSSENEAALIEFATGDCDLVVHAVLGAAGLRASFAAAEAGKHLALANKESLVVAGPLLMDLARRHDATVLPIDSEHSAIFQAMLAGRRQDVERVILTASGGPFRTWPAEQIHSATVEQALDHPTWNMGGAITIDSATLFNKAMEFLEAVRLFDLPPEQIEVVIHPQSIVHSMVEFVDGSTIAQLSPPDMKLPIAYAMTYPERLRGEAKRMDWTSAVDLNFEPPDEVKFPALRLAREAAAEGKCLPAVLNAAKEVATGQFLAGKIAFGRISEVVERVMTDAMTKPGEGDWSTLDGLLEVDARARLRAQTCCTEAAG